MSSDTLTDQEELQAYHLAYFQIFRTILKKRGMDPARQKPVLQKLRQFQLARIKNTDDYLDHIPDFARALGVKPDQLGAFIGSNLLKALQMVKDQMEQQKKLEKKAAAPATNVAVADPAAARSILVELLGNFGPAIEAPDQFKPYQMGFLALNRGGQEIIGRGYYEMQGGSAPAAAPAAPGSSSASQPVGAGAGASASSDSNAVAASASPAMAHEKSILEDILDKFGDGLKVEGKLVVPQFPANQPVAAPAAPGGTNTTSAPANSGSQTASSAGAPAAASPAVAGVEGGSILAEIIEKLGAGLKVSGKLVVEAGVPRGEGAASSAAGTAAASADLASTAAPAFEEIDFDFSDYAETMKKIQGFQQSKDSAGYRNWLNGEATAAARTLLGLRNLETKSRKGVSFDWDDEYYNLSTSVHLQTEQIKDLHQRIRRFDKMQQLINQFVSQVKTQPGPIVQAFKKIWPQVRLIFNDDEDAAHRLSQLKIPLLQIPDQAVKKRISEMLEPVFKKFDQL